jgi:hypothetical protein
MQQQRRCTCQQVSCLLLQHALLLLPLLLLLLLLPFSGSRFKPCAYSSAAGACWQHSRRKLQ